MTRVPLMRPLAVAALAALTTVGIVAGLAPAAQAADRDRGRYVTGWLPYWNSAESTRTVVDNARVFQDASPFVFRISSTNEVTLTDDLDEWRSMRASLRHARVPVVPTVSTWMSADDFADVLTNPRRRTAHVAALAAVANQWNLAGLDLDYESINFGSSQARQEVRRYYPTLVRQLERRLDRQGRRLSVTVAARTSASDPNWWVYAYRDLGLAADRIRIMTYDYHWDGGPAGPIAPKWWVGDVAAFASRVIKPSKISLGMPAYGRDWFGRTISGTCPASAFETVSRTSAEMEQFARSLGKKPEWRRHSSSRTFAYTRTYTGGKHTCQARRLVWYDDADSLRSKLHLVDRYSLRGIAIWALGNEGAGSWPTMARFGRQLARS